MQSPDGVFRRVQGEAPVLVGAEAAAQGVKKRTYRSCPDSSHDRRFCSTERADQARRKQVRISPTAEFAQSGSRPENPWLPAENPKAGSQGHTSISDRKIGARHRRRARLNLRPSTAQADRGLVEQPRAQPSIKSKTNRRPP